MKKLILGSAIVAVLGVASSAMAAPNSGTVNFTGAVSTATCNLSVQDSAGANVSTVNLGTLANTSNADGTLVSFKLVPQDATCLGKADATMTSTSPTLSPTGLSNATTGGTNATMALNATNASGTDKAIKQGNTSFNYTVTGGIKSFDFSAQLKRPTGNNVTMTAGPFSAAASYVVAYK